MLRFLPVLILWFLLDFYVFRGILSATSEFSSLTINLISYSYWIFDAIIFMVLLSLLLSNQFNNRESKGINRTMGLIILSIAPKLTALPLLLLNDTLRVFSFQTVLINQLALVIAGITFIAIIYGLISGKHNYKVHKVKLAFKNLPKTLHGFTITQLSDIHSGSFTNAKAVMKGVELANQQKSDVIVFTGDLVNNKAEEMQKWIPVFSKLEAPLGKFSILGNHDYGDYVPWESAQAKANNLQNLKDVHPEIGFKLLLNENIKINKNGQSITLVGVENWGKRGFTKYGDLNKALEGTNNDEFKILLSHDPSHWEAEVLNHAIHVDLTLSGHTHGMQFGLEIFGFKWSPIKYIYRQWAGAYQKDEKHIYVNRGFGFLGFPGRVGILPEITVIELVSTQ